jgi:hypothetical protein
VKDSYVSYVLEEYIADGNFDASFGEGWIDEAQLAELISITCDYAFAEYGIDAGGKYASAVSSIFEELKANNAIVHQGDDYAGNWYRLRPPHKVQYLNARRAKNPATNLVGTLGKEALRRALTKIVSEDGLRSMEEKWAANNQPDSEEAESFLSEVLQSGPRADFFESEARKQSFSDAVSRAVADVEESSLSNSDKAQAHGYLTAARALSETPDPPVDLIWSILGRANNLAGIGSFFLALITLIAMVVS